LELSSYGLKLSLEEGASFESADFDFGVVRRSFDDEFVEELEDELEEEPVNDFTLGVSTPIEEQVLARRARGLLLASS